MVRTIDLPEYADIDALQYDIASDGILTAQMPLNLPQKTEPPPGVVPIVTNNGRRSIRLQFRIGSDFTMDDVQVRPHIHCVFVFEIFSQSAIFSTHYRPIPLLNYFIQ